MTEELRLGVVGCGSLGTRLIEQFAAVEGVTIAGLTDIDASNLEETGRQFAVPEGARFTDLAAMLEARALDAIQITTPHTLHSEQILAGFEHDLHVYCEKPLVTDLDHAKEIHRRDRANDSVLMVGYQRHLDPAFLQVSDRYADGALEPRMMTVEITQDLLGLGGWYTDPSLSGGGQLYATGTHVIDALLWSTGLDPVEVTAALDCKAGTDRLDKHAALTIRFANEAVATLAISGDTRRVREHHHYWDDEGAIYVEGREWDPRTVRTIDADGVEHSPHLGGPSKTKAEAFIEAIREDETPPATSRDALRATVIKEAAYQAEHEGQTVDVSDWL